MRFLWLRRYSSSTSRRSGPITRPRSRAATTSARRTDAVGRVAEAIALHETNLKLSEAKQGRNNPDTLFSRASLAFSYSAGGRQREAIALFGPTITSLKTILGPDNKTTLNCRRGFANALLASGKIAEAVAMHETNVKLADSKLTPDHPK